MLLTALLLAVVAFSARPGDVLSQDSVKDEGETVGQLVRCLEIEEDGLRLQCYDSLVQSLAETHAGPAIEAKDALHAFSGQDDQDIETLTLESPWRLRWVLDGSLLTVELRADDDSLIGVVGNQIGAGSGESETLEPGVYRIAVRAIGSWQLTVEPE